MKEFIEKLISRLEEERKEYYKDYNTYKVERDLGNVDGLRHAIKIVNELAEEYESNLSESLTSWIPVTERLPDNEYETVLAVSKQEDGYYYFVAVYTSKHGFRTEDCGVYEEPTAWLPLPELYKPQAEQEAQWKEAVMNHFMKVD